MTAHLKDKLIHGYAGLGLRRRLISKHIADKRLPSFWEIAPENWIGIGGEWYEKFQKVTSNRPMICHGLSLSLGSPDPIEIELVSNIKSFIEKHNVLHYSEHCSFTSANGPLYELFPIPFTKACAKYVIERIDAVQQILGQSISIENVSYYLDMQGEMQEVDFLMEIVEQSKCMVLLDVNNLWCNHINHGTDPELLIDQLPVSSVSYLHIAGHAQAPNDMVIDTHGAAVIDPVWNLLSLAYRKFGVLPTVLERDGSFPPMDDLFQELECISSKQASALA